MNLREAIVSKTKQIACAIADNGQQQAAIWDEAISENPFVGIGQGSNLFSPYPIAELLCGDAPSGGDPIPPFTDAPTFTGGQCPGIRYTVNYQYDDFRNGVFNSTETAGNAGIRGPIEGIAANVTGNITTIVISHNGGTTNARFETNSTIEWRNAEITSVVREDGQPDNCGDPPGGGISPQPIPIDYDDADGNPTTSTPVVTPRRPIFGPGGIVSLPFSFDFDFGLVTPTLNINTGDISLNFGTGGPPGGACCPPFDPDSPEPPPGPDDPPEPEDNKRFAGVIVTATQISPNAKPTQIDGGGGLPLFIPRLASLSFAVEIGGRRCWTEDINVRKSRQFVPVNGPAFGYAWRIYDEPGITTTVTPVYVQKEQSSE